MNKKKILVLLLTFLMAFQPVLPVLATGEETGVTENTEAEAVSEEDVEWLSEDFTYTEMSKTLYGCDYTRQFTITGQAISGFSESGLEKLEKTTDLVIPSTDTEGNKLVGIADDAFREKGLTSVTFPTGMMVDYDDTITHTVTRRGNFIIGASAFYKNNLTEVTLPEGVIAVLPNAFMSNQLKKVSLPHTIWWIETQSFAKNELTTVGFPKTCDFQLEIHGMPFVQNNIRWVRLPDYVEVVNKHAFYFNPGMEDCPDNAPDDEKEKGGVVYMYTDNAALAKKDRIHHIEKTAETQHSWHQKLIVETAPDGEWTADDFTYEGTTITGFSESGILKRVANSDLVLPDKNTEGNYVTAIADAQPGGYGLFAEEDIQFDSLTLPAKLEKIGAYAFQNNGLDTIKEFPNTLKEIGNVAFQTNDLKSVILPDSVTTVGTGAFATNPLLETVILSKGMTEIASGSFGCSDATHYMTNLTELTLHEGITKIGSNAFAGNNIKNLVIPSTVTEIGDYAFSTKNYLNGECTLTLPEGLVKIGKYAFRNKVIKSVILPSTVEQLLPNTFTKEYSTGEAGVITTVYVTKAQLADATNFPASDYHKYALRADENDTEWTAYDFTYGNISMELYPVSDQSDVTTIAGVGITGLTESGAAKVERNPDVILPAEDTDGNKIVGIGEKAFYKLDAIESVTFPEGTKDYLILANAFYGNKIEELDLSGVAYVGMYALRNNKLVSVKFDENIWQIANGAFAGNRLQFVEFPEKTTNALNIDNMAFMGNQIKAIRIPDNTEKLTYYAFLQNPGMEDIASEAPTAAKKGGVVYLYTANEELLNGKYIQHVDGTGSGTTVSGSTKSWVQKIVVGDVPETLSAWNVSDFIIEGTVIKGLSETGKKKCEAHPIMILPDENADGTVLTAIVDSAFKETGIVKVLFPEGIQNIGASAFEGCLLEEVVIPDTVTMVGKAAFKNLANLENVVLSEMLTEIPDSMFENASGNKTLTEIDIPENVTKIGDYAFFGHGCTEIEIPDAVSEIGAYAFGQVEEVSTLEQVSLPVSLKVIGDRAFQNTKITTLELPATVTTLPKEAFYKSEAVKGVVQLYTDNKEQLKDNGAGFYAKSDYHKVVFSNLIGTGWTYDDFTFDGATVTGWSEQGQKTRLTVKELIIPQINPRTGETITAIGNNAFAIPGEEVEQLKNGVSSPNGMTNIVIPETVTAIGDKAFEYNSVTEISLPKGLQTIGGSAFHGNQLTKLVLPDSVVSVGTGAFATNNITELTLSKKMTVIEAGTFSMNIRLEQIELHEGITEIGDTAFAGARLTSLEIPSTVTKIGRKAFHLHHMTEVNIPGNVKEIGDSAFEGTPKAMMMKTVTIGEGVESIGSRAFACGYVESVNLPGTVKTLGLDAFEENAGTDNDHIVVCYVKKSEPVYEALKDLELVGAVIVAVEDGFGEADVYRIWGANRYETSYKTADAYKAQLGIDKFETVIVADGKNFPDALAGSYLASVKSAPILMANKSQPDALKAYIKENLKEGGTIYVLGGVKALPEKVVSGLNGYKICRLAGENRYETNLKILEEAGVTNQEILVCTGLDFADSLSASATGKPILLVGKSLTADQKTFLSNHKNNKYYVIGGTNAISSNVEKAIQTYGSTQRLQGATRYETSVKVAEEFFEAPSVAVLAYAKNFPDGLSGGPLAMSKNGPLILTTTGKETIALQYTSKNGIKKGAVLGGSGLISDAAVKKIFEAQTITEW